MIMADSQEDNKDETLSHTAAMDRFKKQLAELVTSDPLLCDLPSEVTVEEINSQIALEYGQAMTVNVHRADDKVISVVVTQTATVLDLKNAIKRQFTLQMERDGGNTRISCNIASQIYADGKQCDIAEISRRYVWKRYWLYFDGQKMMDDNKKLKEYGIRNKDEVTFVKRLKER